MLTSEQKQQRRKYIGSSDIAAICGKDPWRSAMDVYLSKTQELDDKPSEAMQTGTRLEGVVLDWAQEKIGLPLLRDQFRTAGIFCANHDALVRGKLEGVEAKTARIISQWAGDEWGEEGDDVPDHVLIQCQEQMHVSSLELVWVPVLIGGRGWCMFRVERSQPLIDTIVQRGEKFWREHVELGIPPADSAPSLEIARSIRRTPGKVIQMPVEPVQRWLAAKDAMKVVEEERENAEALLLTYMGDAEAGDTALGRVTFMEQSMCRLDGAALRTEQPEIAKQYETISKYRVLRWKGANHKPKGAKES